LDNKIIAENGAEVKSSPEYTPSTLEMRADWAEKSLADAQYDAEVAADDDDRDMSWDDARCYRPWNS
jgi:hypothetical protein